MHACILQSVGATVCLRMLTLLHEVESSGTNTYGHHAKQKRVLLMRGLI